MATFNKFNQFVEDVVKGRHVFQTDTFKIALTATLPVATNTIFANITEIAAGNGYTAGGGTATYTSATQTSGTLKAIFADVTFTASGGSITPFQYAVFYNSATSSAASGSIVKPLIGWYDYGASITITNGNSFLVDLDQTNGLLTLV